MLKPSPIYIPSAGNPSSFDFFSFLLTFLVLAAPAIILAMVTTFDLFPIILFVPCLKIYDPSDRRIMITLSDDSERTGLINRSGSRTSIVPISNHSSDIIDEPISGKKTANIPLNTGDCSLRSSGFSPHWVFR